MSAECFKLDYLEKILLEPRDLLEFISTFTSFEDNTITVSPTHKFIKHASNYFDMPLTDVKKLLVFDDNNKSICPLFVRFRDRTLGDIVCITKDFSRFIYTILHSILAKDLFEIETVRLSKDFESVKVKTEFERNGYVYRTNITNKKKATLQIDGLAIKKSVT